MKTAVKVLLSLFICFHLLAILVLPNPNSLPNRELPLLSTYGNLLAINTTWRFFSPNPLIKTVEYETYKYDDNYNVIETKEYKFPLSVEDIGGREAYNRTLNYAMIAVGHPDWAYQLLGPVLCRKHPEVDEIAIYQLRRDYVPIEKAQILESYEKLYEVIRDRVTDVSCKDLKEAPDA